MITQTQTTSFKTELLTGVHNFGVGVIRAATTADTFKIALYTSSATLDADTTVYTATGEVANGNGYTTGGETLTVTAPTSSGTTAYLDFADVSWSGAITANGALIYNSTQGNKAVAVLAFGSNKTSTTTFQITFPAGDADNAIVRIA